MLMGEVEVPDGGSHDGCRLRRMHFYARHGFELEPVKSRVYGVTYRVISYARPRPDEGGRCVRGPARHL